MTRSIRYLFYSFLLFSIPVCAQQFNRMRSDSLFSELKRSLPDTSTCDAYIMLSKNFIEHDRDSAYLYARRADSLAQKLGNKRLMANAYFCLGKTLSDKELYPEALQYYFKALPLAEETKQVTLHHRLYNNVGNIYSFLRQNDNAQRYFIMAAQEAASIDDKLSQAKYFVNIGTTYKRMKKNALASEFYLKAKNAFAELHYVKGTMQCNINIATLYASEQKWDVVEEYLTKALYIADSLHDAGSLVTIYNNLGGVNANAGNYKRAMSMFDSAAFYCKKIGSISGLSDAYSGMAEVYEGLGDYKMAVKYGSMHSHLEDSINNATSMEQIAHAEAKYNFMAEEKELELRRANDEIQGLELNKRKAWIFVLILGLGLAGVLVLLFLGRLRQNRKQTQLLEHHNTEIEHQKKEITDSINYAKKIQMSILPPDTLVNALLPDSFVLYKPKDIVSGDFYWVDECDGKVLFAAVDCTGHGVPGAMMSVLGFNLLSQAVNEKRITRPGSVLEHLDFGVDKMLRQSTDENSVRDGMDLSLCCIDYKTGILQFAGAYNGLWIVKHEGKELVEIKPDKMMIGVNAGGEADHFTNHEIQLQKGDTVYIFSDGYADQFGGPGGKKFKYKPLKQLLVDLHDLPMREQRSRLDENIETWRGNLEQVDDILVIGVRYS